MLLVWWKLLITRVGDRPSLRRAYLMQANASLRWCFLCVFGSVTTLLGSRGHCGIQAEIWGTEGWGNKIISSLPQCDNFYSFFFFKLVCIVALKCNLLTAFSGSYNVLQLLYGLIWCQSCRVKGSINSFLVEKKEKNCWFISHCWPLLPWKQSFYADYRICI